MCMLAHCIVATMILCVPLWGECRIQSASRPTVLEHSTCNMWHVMFRPLDKRWKHFWFLIVVLHVKLVIFRLRTKESLRLEIVPSTPDVLSYRGAPWVWEDRQGDNVSLKHVDVLECRRKVRATMSALSRVWISPRVGGQAWRQCQPTVVSRCPPVWGDR